MDGIIAVDHDLIGSTGNATLIGNVALLLNIDPKLGKLGKHGGPTMTMLLLTNSPGLDAGSNPDNLTDDQRGGPRLVGAAVDLGAVEVS